MYVNKHDMNSKELMSCLCVATFICKVAVVKYWQGGGSAELEGGDYFSTKEGG